MYTHTNFLNIRGSFQVCKICVVIDWPWEKTTKQKKKA